MPLDGTIFEGPPARSWRPLAEMEVFRMEFVCGVAPSLLDDDALFAAHKPVSKAAPAAGANTEDHV